MSRTVRLKEHLEHSMIFKLLQMLLHVARSVMGIQIALGSVSNMQEQLQIKAVQYMRVVCHLNSVITGDQDTGRKVRRTNCINF